MSGERNDHPGPDLLVDLAEGTPVAARWKEHLGECPSCAKDVARLRDTLSWVRAASKEADDPIGGTAFLERFRERVAREADREARRGERRWRWAAGLVAAGLAISLWVGWEGLRREDSLRPASGWSDLLPPTEQDPEFQFLLSVAAFTDSELEPQDVLDLSPEPSFSLAELAPELTTEELREFVEGLEPVP